MQDTQACGLERGAHEGPGVGLLLRSSTGMCATRYPAN